MKITATHLETTTKQVRTSSDTSSTMQLCFNLELLNFKEWVRCPWAAGPIQPSDRELCTTK